MGIAVVDGLGTRQHYLLEELDDPLFCFVFARRFMLQNHFANLETAFVDGIERGHGFLKNHGDAFASHIGHVFFPIVLDFLASDLDAVGLDTAHPFVEQTHHRQ